MKKLDTAELGPVKIEPPKIDSLLKLLQHIDILNMRAEPGVTYYTATVMYNTVVWRRDAYGSTMIIEVYPGVLS